jgi:2,4-dienoyl-CoA reductase-like NADH-dependent reductase (Old Yellow Enzyme family)
VLAHNALFATKNPLGRAAFRLVVSPFMNSRHKPYSEGYNLAAAAEAARLTRIPVFAVGGWRSGVQMRKALAETDIAGIALCRPLLREPDFVTRLEADEQAVSTCTNCNRCAVMCDSTHPTRCYETQ